MNVEFEAVEKRYQDGTIALKSVSFAVPSRQLCVLLGASGAGKSTLLRSVNGLTTPSSGRVRVDGVAVDRRSVRTLRRRIGTVHQNYALAPRLSVAQNVLSGALAEISTPAAWLGLFPRACERKAVELITAVGLSRDLLARRAGSLSGGEQQRVGIARALMNDPAIILADEPVASLDPKSGVDIIRLLAEQAREREATLICSLHQIDLAKAIADRIVGLHRGDVVFDDRPDALDEAAFARIYDSREAA